jgi:hypothetical protein
VVDGGSRLERAHKESGAAGGHCCCPWGAPAGGGAHEECDERTRASDRKNPGAKWRHAKQQRLRDNDNSNRNNNNNNNNNKDDDLSQVVTNRGDNNSARYALATQSEKTHDNIWHVNRERAQPTAGDAHRRANYLSARASHRGAPATPLSPDRTRSRTHSRDMSDPAATEHRKPEDSSREETPGRRAAAAQASRSPAPWRPCWRALELRATQSER